MPPVMSIPPLIPLPAEDSKEDLFSTLFSPATPRPSPTHTPAPDTKRANAHSRTSSLDSEFGAFVSVSSAEDPLHEPSEELPFTPLQNFEFFDRFTGEARAATERNKKGLLDELLQHEDDPLYWLSPDASTADPQPLSAASSLIDLVSDSDLHIRDTLDALSHSSAWTPPSPGSSSTRPPSLPPPSRPSDPEIQRTPSSFFAPSTFSTASLPTRWMSSLLARPSPQRTPTSTSADHSASDDDDHTNGPLYAARRTAKRPTPSPHQQPLAHARSRTVPSDSAPAAITHGTPFAAHPFVPPSGAPGFGGDRMWNKGFEFDKDRVERASVKLSGRKDATLPVLTVELADMLRPNFPALARLPRTWTLLYSLDQHGISLNTLYARCEPHSAASTSSTGGTGTGGALVAIKDAGDAVFGAWLGEGVRPSRGAYFGSGESFLWRLTREKRLKVYKWTGKNDYIALCEPEYLSFGGGDGEYGIYLDSTLADGSSAPCPTFANDPLCSAGPRQGGGTAFECVGLEVWGVG